MRPSLAATMSNQHGDLSAIPIKTPLEGSLPLPDELIDHIISNLEPLDRNSFSEVCKQVHKSDSETRKHVTIEICYATTPSRVRQRFPNLESLKLKGRPNYMIEKNSSWGGNVTPWVTKIQNFPRLSKLHFVRMVVKDSNLKNLAEKHGGVLQALQMEECSEFSTNGLLHIAHHCKQLRVLLLEKSSFDYKGSSREWLSELALNNNVLETLNLYRTGTYYRVESLELFAKNCSNLVYVKVDGEYDILLFKKFFRVASALEEFYG